MPLYLLGEGDSSFPTLKSNSGDLIKRLTFKGETWAANRVSPKDPLKKKKREREILLTLMQLY